MARLAALAALALLVAAGVVAVQRLDQDRRYRQILAEGEHALADGQTYQAIELFSGALALRPRSMVAYYRRGEAYAEERLYDKAVSDLREAARLSPTAPQPLEALGRIHEERGEPAQAAEWYRQAVARVNEADPALLYALALALYRSGAPAAAREPLQLALARHDTAEGHYLLGLVSRDTRNMEEAVASLERAVRLVPTMIDAREELADLYRALGRHDAELRELGALAVLDNQPGRRVAIGLAESRAARHAAALRTLETIPAGGHDSGLMLARGRVLLAEAERTHDRSAVMAALAALEQALGGTARRSEGLALYGRALYLSGDADAAVRILQEALATSPLDVAAFGYLADAAERAGLPFVARKALLDLEALQGDTVTAAVRASRARRMGILSLAGGDARSAVRFLEQAADVTSLDMNGLTALARARWQRGDDEGARAAVDQALALGAPDVELQRLLRTLR
jgi:tetratricopeptide (TPR) repeat protein